MPSFPNGPYQIYFYSDEGMEPPHVHVRRERMIAKFWLLPIELADPGRFPPVELRKIHKILVKQEVFLWERWNEHFRNR